MKREYPVRLAIGFAITLLFSYQFFWYAYKYDVPWAGQNDFQHYYPLVLEPFRYHAETLVFSFRIFTPLIAHLLLKLHVFYDNAAQFDAVALYRGQLFAKPAFFAMLFANWLGIVATGALLYARMATREGRNLSLYGIIAVAAMLLAFSMLATTIAPLAEGWSWFLILLILLLMQQTGRAALLALPLILLSIFQRELLPLFAGVFAAAELLTLRANAMSLKGRAGYLWSVVAVCALAFGIYAGLVELTHMPAKYQAAAGMHWMKLGENLRERILTGAFVKQSLLSLNLCMGWIALEIAARRTGRVLAPRPDHVAIAVVAIFALMLAMGIASGIWTNLGRLYAILTPIFALQIGERLRIFTEARSP